MSEKPDHSLDRLDRALAKLPPAMASPGFTRKVLAALDEAPDRTRGRGNGRYLVLAAAAVLAVAAGLYLGARLEPPTPTLAAERADLRQEHDALMRELESLRTLARETRPVLYLGSGDDADYVLDLSPLVESPPVPGTQPAGLAPSDRPRPRYF